MPLTEDEIINLSDEVWDLLGEIAEIKSSDSDKGKKISRKEARSLLKSITALAFKLTVQIMD